jgi:hypothetical protein
MAKEYIEQRSGVYCMRVTEFPWIQRYTHSSGESHRRESMNRSLRWGQNRSSERSRSIWRTGHVDSYLRETEREFEAMRQQARRDHPASYAKLAQAWLRTHIPTA